MLVNRLHIALLFALTSSSAFAATDSPYQHDAGITYSASTDEFSEGTWNADYRYYFTPVSQDSAPYALSGFLAQTSNIAGSYNINDDTDFYHINGQYVFASKWFIGANYAAFDNDFNDINAYGASLGYYFNASSAVYLDYSKTDSKSEFAEDMHGKTDSDYFSLGVRSFIALQSTAGVDLLANVSYSESTSTINYDTYSTYHDKSDDTFVNLSASWYLTRSWSLGGHYTVQDGNDSSNIYTRYYWRLTDLISAQASLNKFIESDIDDLSLALGINGRF